MRKRYTHTEPKKPSEKAFSPMNRIKRIGIFILIAAFTATVPAADRSGGAPAQTPGKVANTAIVPTPKIENDFSTGTRATTR
jgi:hypothetical protein